MIKLALVVPCQNFIQVAFDVFECHRQFEPNPDHEEYYMEEIVVTEQNVSKVKIDADVIISRGLLAEILHQERDIPVVEIPVPATDTLRRVIACAKKYHAKKIGVIAAHNIAGGLSELSDLAPVEIATYILEPNWNGTELVDRAVKEGCEAIVGGLNTCNYAETVNIDHMFIETGQDSFWQSITAAKRVVQFSRAEQEKTSRLQIVLNTSKEGLLAIDTQSRVQMLNKSAAKILQLERPIIGLHLEDTPFPEEFKKLLTSGDEYSDELFKYRDVMLTVGKYPIRVSDAVAGMIISLRPVKDIVTLENSIRKKIHSKGHVAKASFNDIIGDAPIMRRMIATAKKFSRTDSNVLLIGQSGTGKEILAQSMHNHSFRRHGPFVAVNCAAIPDSLLESELFGYASGAFTGAQKSGKPGFFELAHTGTIFLDEIGEIPMRLQAKLLRALQEREIMRLGDGSVIPVDIRVIAATNQNLEHLIELNSFRQDLFYRLDVLRIHIPALDDRPEDIPLLAEYFLQKNFPLTHISTQAKNLLGAYHWKGNTRHLFNICERLAVMNEGSLITAQDVMEILPEITRASLHPSMPKSTDAETDERIQILHALEQSRYNRTKAAECLKINRSTLWRKMKIYNL